MTTNPNSYKNQKLRGLKRKYEAIIQKGGKCEICGYDKNISALEFHHIDPSNKNFQLDSRHFSNNTIDNLQNEINKCILLCANCHREIHNPSLKLEEIDNIIGDIKKTSFTNKKEKKKCLICGKIIKNANGKIYCSNECREIAKNRKLEVKNYPTLSEINEQYEILGSWEKVAEYYHLTRKIIQGIRKRG